MRVARAGAKRITLAATPLADPATEHVFEDAEPTAYRMRRFRPPATGPGGPCWFTVGWTTAFAFGRASSSRAR